MTNLCKAEKPARNVEFFIPLHRITNCKGGAEHYLSVIDRTLGTTPGEFLDHVVAAKPYGDKGDWVNGVRIVCSEQQFTRFLIARDVAGIPNYFHELMPRLVPVDQEYDPYAAAAEKFGVHRETIKNICHFMSYTPELKDDRLKVAGRG